MKKKKIILAIASLPLLTSVFGIPLSISESESFKETTSISKNKSSLNAYDSDYYVKPTDFKKNFAEGVPKTLEELNNLKDAEIQNVIKANKYDSRNYDIVTPGVNQGNSKLCWSYGTKFGIETSLLKNKVFKGNYNDLKLSGTNITYVTKIRNGDLADPLGFSAGDSFTQAYEAGGQLWESMSMMTQWTSPKNLGYEDLATWYDNTLEYAAPKDIVGVPGQIINLKNSSKDEVTNDEIKAAIVKYGAVTVVVDIGYCQGLYKEYINGSRESNVKHAVTLIGWDDSIKQNKYMFGSSVPGGWIAKNSGEGGWRKNPYDSQDDDFSDFGTIRISMDSKFTQAYAVDYTDYNINQNQYYYDGAADYNNSGRSETKLASIFPAVKESYDKKEILKKVFFGVDSGSNYQAKIKVYKNTSYMNNPEDGTLLGDFTTDTYKYPGYYAVDVPEKMQQELKNGEYFSVIVELTNDAKLMTSVENSTNDYTMYWDATNNKWSNMFDRQSAYGGNYVARVRAITETVDKTAADTPNKNDMKYAQVIVPGEYLTNDSPYCYDSYYKKPEPKVILNGKTLVKDKDYKLEYKQVLDSSVDTSKISSDSKIVGYETITVKGMGEYSGINNTTRFNIKVGLLPPGLDKLGTWNTDPKTNKGLPSYWNPVEVKIKSSVKKYGQIDLPPGWEWSRNKSENIQLDTALDCLTYKGNDAQYFRKTGANLKFVIDDTKGLDPNKQVYADDASSTDNNPSVTPVEPSTPVETTTPVDNNPSESSSSSSSSSSSVESTQTPADNTPSVTPAEDNKPANNTPSVTPADSKPVESTSATQVAPVEEVKNIQELDQFISDYKVEPIKVNSSATATAELNTISKDDFNVYFELPKDTKNVKVTVSNVSRDANGNIIVEINFSLENDPTISKVQTYSFNSQSFTQSAPKNNTIAIAAGAAAGAVAILAAASIAGFVIYKKKHPKK